MSNARSLVLVGLAAALAAGCATQRHPGPLSSATEPLPPGEGLGALPGPEEIVVVRHADPVFLRAAGENVGRPLAFWDKQERVLSGTWVRCGYGGRAEVLWPGREGSLVVFDGGDVYLGEPTRDEPSATLVRSERCRLTLWPGQRVSLADGAVLSGDPDLATGPFVVERIGTDVVRLTNQSKRDARVEFRDDVLELRGNEAVDLPELASGAAPRLGDPARIRLEGARNDHLEAWVLGDVVPTRAPGGALVLDARSSTSVDALGVHIRLAPGEALALARPGALPPAPPTPAEPASADE